MKQKIDLETWKRKEHYEFFRNFEEQFHGVSVQMNMTRFYEHANQFSWHKSSAYFHKCIKAVNQVEAFRLRMENDAVFLYDRIDFGMTVLREDRTFAYSYTEYHPDYKTFAHHLKKEFDSVKSSRSLRHKSSNYSIHGSVLPWINFTGLSHARNFNRADSSPKITFGKITKVHKEYLMPLSVHVNHCLVDGIDLGDFIELYQSYLDQI